MVKKRTEPEYRAPLRKSGTQTWRPGGLRGEGTAHRPEIEKAKREAELKRQANAAGRQPAQHDRKSEAAGFGALVPQADGAAVQHVAQGEAVIAGKRPDLTVLDAPVPAAAAGAATGSNAGAGAATGRTYQPGDVVKLTAVREDPDMGVFLDAGTGSTDDDILLHKLQMTAPVQVGDQVEVYLYLDPKRRLTASMHLPRLREGELGYARVIDVKKIGGFVDLGAERGVFLPYTEMRGHVNPGQQVWVRLYRDKTGRQAVTMRVDKDMARLAKPAEGLKRGDRVTGTIYNITNEGFFLITNEKNIGFLHRSEAPAGRRLDFGEELTCRVIFVREDGRLNLSLREQKEDALMSDSELLLRTMQARNGRMPYDDHTTPEILKTKFGLTKAAFKRALGHLMKQGWATQAEGWTALTEAGKAQAESLAQQEK